MKRLALFLTILVIQAFCASSLTFSAETKIVASGVKSMDEIIAKVKDYQKIVADKRRLEPSLVCVFGYAAPTQAGVIKYSSPFSYAWKFADGHNSADVRRVVEIVRKALTGPRYGLIGELPPLHHDPKIYVIYPDRYEEQ